MPLTPPSSPLSRPLARTVLLGAALVAVPLLLGTFYALLQGGAAARGRTPDPFAALTNRLEDLSVRDVASLSGLYLDARTNGVSTETLALRLWAATGAEPAVLFRVPPPEPAHEWAWRLSRDGRYAVAAALPADTAGRRRVGLYDLAAGTWLWTATLPWPAAHDDPYVFASRLLVRYARNGRDFALEISPDGRITALDTLPAASHRTPSVIPAPDAAFPGTPVADRCGIRFVTAPDRQTLLGYARHCLPGLADAGPGDEHTTFSGNGRLRFDAAAGRVTLSDSLTGTVLQRISAWRHTTNTVVTGTLASRDGANLSVFLKTAFGGEPAVTRDWSVTVSTYAGTVSSAFGTAQQPHRSARTRRTEAVSPDNAWLLALAPSNGLSLCTLPSRRELARVRLDLALGSSAPVTDIAFLEEGRHVVLRQGARFWLLDFAAARGYADLVARMSASDLAVRLAQTAPAAEAPARADPEPEDEDGFAPLSPLDLPSPSPVALRAERLAAHQAWPYAAWLLDLAAEHAALDSRAPRINPLLHTRAHLLAAAEFDRLARADPAAGLARAAAAGQQQARLLCRRASLGMLYDASDYNRMARYHLQGLLFAQP